MTKLEAKSKVLNTLSDEMRLSDLTVGQFKALMGEMFQELVWQIEDRLPDDSPLRPEVEEYLRTPLAEKGTFYSGDEIKRELGLDD